MAKRALCIGINNYPGTDMDLSGCINDANDWAEVLSARKFDVTMLLDKQATRAAMAKAMSTLIGAAAKGDVIVITFSGHGTTQPDDNGDEADGIDEGFAPHDIVKSGALTDDEIHAIFLTRQPGVRITLLSDSCHSGTVTRAGPPAMGAQPSPEWRSRMMPLEVGRRTYEQHQAFYDGLQKAVAQAAGGVVDPDAALAALSPTLHGGRITSIAAKFKPTVLLISGCQDNQTSMDGPHNGAFTGRLLRVWNHGRYVGSYASFHATIRSGMPASQSPNLYTLGPGAAALLAQQPFKI